MVYVEKESVWEAHIKKVNEFISRLEKIANDKGINIFCCTPTKIPMNRITLNFWSFKSCLEFIERKIDEGYTNIFYTVHYINLGTEAMPLIRKSINVYLINENKRIVYDLEIIFY